MKMTLFLLAFATISGFSSANEVPDHCTKLDLYENCVRDTSCEWDRVKESCVSKPASESTQDLEENQ